MTRWCTCGLLVGHSPVHATPIQYAVAVLHDGYVLYVSKMIDTSKTTANCLSDSLGSTPVNCQVHNNWWQRRFYMMTSLRYHRCDVTGHVDLLIATGIMKMLTDVRLMTSSTTPIIRTHTFWWAEAAVAITSTCLRWWRRDSCDSVCANWRWRTVSFLTRCIAVELSCINADTLVISALSSLLHCWQDRYTVFAPDSSCVRILTQSPCRFYSRKRGSDGFERLLTWRDGHISSYYTNWHQFYPLLDSGVIVASNHSSVLYRAQK